jgi:hypothetical protein
MKSLINKENEDVYEVSISRPADRNTAHGGRDLAGSRDRRVCLIAIPSS